MDNDALPTMPCPVCDGCDHDMRGGLLDFLTNIQDNLKQAGETLLDAMEAEGDGATRFIEALKDVAIVRRQIDVLLELTPEIATIKAAHA